MSNFQVDMVLSDTFKLIHLVMGFVGHDRKGNKRLHVGGVNV